MRPIAALWWGVELSRALSDKVMTNTERILAALRAEPGLSDGQLRQRTGVDPHQQVNQICRRLEGKGRLRRLVRADGRIGNYPSEGVVPPVRLVDPPSKRPPSPTVELPQLVPVLLATAPALPTTTSTLIILPCSGRKTAGGTSALGLSVLDLLSPALADCLVEARRRVGSSAKLDETRRLPAWHRYSGTLYEATGGRLAKAVTAGVPILIVSGGYGLALAEEPIGMYNCRFSLRDWPRHLLEECLAVAAQALGVRTAIAFCARTTEYAALIRRTPWSKHGIAAWLAGTDMGGRGGAQVFVPRASGEAFAAFVNGEFHDRWVSADGIPVRLEPVA